MVRQIVYDDFHQVENLPPDEWNFNYTDFLLKHIQEAYFYAIVTLAGSEITGTGNAFNFGKTGWLANIIVRPEYRNKGIGLLITEYLIRYLQKAGCQTLFLLATESGKNIYQRAGFKSVINYRYFATEYDKAYTMPKEIRKVRQSDLEEIVKLDAVTTGEDRSLLLKKFYKNGWVYSADSYISGFFIPDFGRGVVIAGDKQAGLKLIGFKHSMKHTRSAVPEINHDVVMFFKEMGLKEKSSCSRMILGNQIEWNPQNIYSYAHGYCG